MKRSNAMIVKEAALPTDYGHWIQAVKDRVRNAQLRTMVAVNVEQLLLYWDIGHDILERQKNEGWGAKVIQKMSEDLGCEFPTNNGFSVRNLKYMRAFAAAWPNRKLIVQAPLAQLAWYSQIALIEKLKTREDRLGYARLAVENHWMRPQLVREIAARSIENLGKSTSSVGANYREANRGESGDDFRHKISIALKEANESLYWLEILADLYPTHETPVKLRNEAEELLKLLQSISRSSRTRAKSNNQNNPNNRTILCTTKG